MTGNQDTCPWCQDTGWTGTADADGGAYVIACPNGCFTPQDAA